MQQIILEKHSVQPLSKYKQNKVELMNKLNNKTKLEDNKELIEYLSQVKELENQRINYIDKIEKNSNIMRKNKELINKISNLFSQRLRLEIDNINEKSTEVSINILNSTIGSINEHIKNLIENSETNYETMSFRESPINNINTKNLSITIPDKDISEKVTGDQYEYKYQ